MSGKPEVNVPKVYTGIFDDRFGQWLSGRLVPRIPAGVRPNHVTWMGFGSALMAAGAFYLGGFSRWWLLLAALGVFLMWLADTVDGDLARSRSMTSERGYFLDEALDTLSHMAMYLAIALASYTTFQVIIMVPIIHLMHEKLIGLWVHLRGEHVFPALAGTQVSLLMIAGALLTFVSADPLVFVGDLALGWFDLMVMAGSVWGLADLVSSGRRLYGELR